MSRPEANVLMPPIKLVRSSEKSPLPLIPALALNFPL